MGPMRVALLLAPLLMAGCTGVSIQGLTPSEAPREPWYEEHRDLVAPQHSRAYEVHVTEEATLLNATVRLIPQTNGVPTGPTAPPAAAPATTPATALTPPAPARLLLEVFDPSGREVGEAEADPSEPVATLLVQEPAEAGTWTVRVTGTGASGRLDGQEYGASYLLSIEVLHG